MNTPNNALTVEVSAPADDVAVITVAGEIDITTVEELRAAVAQAARAHATGIVFDLSGVDFMDSSGIAALIDARGAAPRVSLRDPSLPVRRLLITTGLTDVLPAES